MKDKLIVGIILASIREQRAGEKVAKWILQLATQQPELDPKLVDLKKFPLPFYHYSDQPNEIENAYSGKIEKQWYETINSTDGFIIVTPEYNWGYPSQLKNALDYLYKPWNKKPVAFVSYGGLAAGTRSVEQLRQVVVALQMAPIRGSVHIPYISEAFDKSGQPANPGAIKQAGAMFTQLIWWTKALKNARQELTNKKNLIYRNHAQYY
ncbi:MAG: NAD(P)H-dependent oxidoreductase [Patescibacteria group bacterium]